MSNLQIPDSNQIENAFQIIMTAQNENLRKEADAFLRNLEKNQPYILISLFQIFENSQVFVNRLQSLLLIKNVIVRNWNKSTLLPEGKRISNIPDDLKNHVKDKIIQFLGIIQDQKLKDEINIIIKTISKTDFPLKYQALENYFIQGLQTIVQQNQTGQITSIFSYDLILTLKAVFSEVSKNRNSVFKSQQLQFAFRIWNSIILIWQNITNQQQQELSQTNQCDALLNKISKKLDRVLSQCIMSFHAENDLDKIQQVFKMLIEKTVFVLKIITNQKLLQPNLKTLIHSLGNIQAIFQLSITSNLNDYLILLKLIITSQWEDKRVMRTGLIGLIKILKSFFYFCSEAQFNSTIVHPKLPNYNQIRQQANLIYTNFFTENISSLIETLIAIASIPVDLSDEDLIEQEEDLTIDDVKSEMQCPIYTLCLVCEEQLLQRFSDLFISHVLQIIQKLLSNNFQGVSFQILDSFFALLGQTPRVTLKLKKDPIPIMPILQYLIRNDTVQTQRRFAFLCRNFSQCFTKQELPEVFQYLLILINKQQDQIVQYQSLMCFKNIISTPGQFFEYKDISILLQQLAPVIVKLLCNLQKSNILWPLLQLLEKIIQLCSNNEQSSQLLHLMEQVDLSKLMTTTSELLVGALCDMLKNLFVSFPLGTNLSHLYKLAIILIDSNLSTKANNITEFYLFILMEYEPSIDNNMVGEQLRQLFINYEKSLFDDTDFQNIQTSLKIVEELILMNLIPITHHVLNIIQDRLQIGQLVEQQIVGQQILNYALSLFETILIKQYQILDISQISQLIILLTDKIVKSQKEKNEEWYLNIYCNTHYIELMNRLFIKDPNSVIQILSSISLNYDQYFLFIQEKCQHLDNRGSRKIHVIATILGFKYLTTRTFQQQFQFVIENCFPELDYDADLRSNEYKNQQQQNKLSRINLKQSRLNLYRHSHKKEILQEQCLYDETFSLKNFFFQSIQESLTLHQIADVKQLINDSSTMDKLNQLYLEK